MYVIFAACGRGEGPPTLPLGLHLGGRAGGPTLAFAGGGADEREQGREFMVIFWMLM